MVQARQTMPGSHSAERWQTTIPRRNPVHDTSGPERLRALLLQAILVGLVVVAGLLVFDTVADATTDVRDSMQSPES